MRSGDTPKVIPAAGFSSSRDLRQVKGLVPVHQTQETAPVQSDGRPAPGCRRFFEVRDVS
jgi:hypothetical protein